MVVVVEGIDDDDNALRVTTTGGFTFARGVDAELEVEVADDNAGSEATIGGVVVVVSAVVIVATVTGPLLLLAVVAAEVILLLVLLLLTSCRRIAASAAAVLVAGPLMILRNFTAGLLARRR